ncbi:MAG: fasciclin domain-containing protein [Alphaproteobacteria bacterium]|nr:fasciclin domain-containing protein [Alphaproteobacteria bacterium]
MKNVLRLLLLMLFALVLLPVDGWAKEKEENAPLPNAMKVISGQKELSKFADTIKEAGLEKMFESKDEILTVFAPSNEAFGKAPSDIMKKANADKDHLQSFVKYHVISGSLVSMNNIAGRKAGPATASGESILFDGTGKTIKVNDAEFVTPDLKAGNGIVHIVSAVMVPPSFKEKPAAEQPMPAVPEIPGKQEKQEKQGTKQPETVPAKQETPAAAPVAPEVKATPAPTSPPSLPSAPEPAKQPEGEKKGLRGWLKGLGW